MTNALRPPLVGILIFTFLVNGSGCRLRQPAPTRSEAPLRIFQGHALDVEYPDVAAPIDDELLATPPPMSVVNTVPTQYRDLRLQEAVQLALMNAKVLRDLGGQLIRTPQASATVFGPAIQETDPRFGVEGALSAFDATYSSNAYFEKNDRALNNIFFGGGTRQLQQDAYVFQNQISKRTAAGTAVTLRNITDYDANNAPGNAFPSAWNSNIEMEYRQPLLQGGGVDFNRIAGPGATPGVYNGVLIARINTDVSLTELENGVRLLLSDVENAYWDLYFAYRDLDAKIAARNTALETWRRVRSLFDTGRRGGEAEKEAHAREQYYRFEEEVQNALAGQLIDGTRTYNGSSGGTFRGIGGVQTCERRLRLLLGLPIADGELLRPVDDPTSARVTFDWQQSIAEALSRRVELRKQRWIVKRRELELSASRNFLLPQLDTVGRYRWRGFGNDLANGPPGQEFSSAWGTLFGGQFQEWQLGMEMSVPIGFRRANAAVRNAQMNLSRERVILRELERQVVHDLAGATADADRAFLLTQTTYNRRLATYEQMHAAQAAFDADKVSLDFMLESQRLAADAEVRYHRALVEHAVALKNVQFERGSLLDYDGVSMAESPWIDAAYRSPTRTDGYRLPVGPLNYELAPGRRVSASRHVPEGAPPAASLPLVSPPGVVPPIGIDPAAPTAPIPQQVGAAEAPPPAAVPIAPLPVTVALPPTAPPATVTPPATGPLSETVPLPPTTPLPIVVPQSPAAAVAGPTTFTPAAVPTPVAAPAPVERPMSPSVPQAPAMPLAAPSTFTPIPAPAPVATPEPFVIPPQPRTPAIDTAAKPMIAPSAPVPNYAQPVPVEMPPMTYASRAIFATPTGAPTTQPAMPAATQTPWVEPRTAVEHQPAAEAWPSPLFNGGFPASTPTQTAAPIEATKPPLWSPSWTDWPAKPVEGWPRAEAKLFGQ